MATEKDAQALEQKAAIATQTHDWDKAISFYLQAEKVYRGLGMPQAAGYAAGYAASVRKAKEKEKEPTGDSPLKKWAAKK